MAEQLNADGDFGNILEYFVRMLAIQQRKDFPLHNYTFHYIKHSFLTSADKNNELDSSEFPDKENLDRISKILFLVEADKTSFGLEVGWGRIKVDMREGKLDLGKFTELLDQSTFRFF